MTAIAAPILPGKLDVWKEWIAELNGPRAGELDDLERRAEITRHRAYLQQNPDGGHLVIVVWDGPGADRFLPMVGNSDHPFDVWFRAKVKETHGMDMAAPPGPPPELLLDHTP